MHSERCHDASKCIERRASQQVGDAVAKELQSVQSLVTLGDSEDESRVSRARYYQVNFDPRS